MRKSLGGRIEHLVYRPSQHPFPGGFLGIGGGSDKVPVSTILAFALGVAIGYGVWAAAPEVIGRLAPWNGNWPYYSTVLITASALVALLLPRQYAAMFVGAVLGQLLAKLILLTPEQRLFLTSRRLDSLGLLLTLPGTWLGSKVRNYFSRAA